MTTGFKVGRNNTGGSQNSVREGEHIFVDAPINEITFSALVDRGCNTGKREERWKGKVAERTKKQSS